MAANEILPEPAAHPRHDEEDGGAMSEPAPANKPFNTENPMNRARCHRHCLRHPKHTSETPTAQPRPAHMSPESRFHL